MLKARKKNRIVRIPDVKADEYKKLGYTITDEDGNTVYQPEDKDATIAALRKENQQLKQKITELELEKAQANSGKATEQPETPEEPKEAPKQPEEQAAADDGKTTKGKGTAAKSK